MGDTLKSERARMKVITIVFSLGYSLYAVYYIFQLTIFRNDCNKKVECPAYVNLLIGILFMAVCDLIPNFVLYYCHYEASHTT